jgi:hypothetical protein
MPPDQEDTLARTLASVRANVDEMRARGELPPEIQKSRWRSMRELVLPDDIAAIFADLGRTFRAAPLWRKPIMGIAIIFGAALHVLTAARIAGMVLVCIVPIIAIPAGIFVRAYQVSPLGLCLGSNDCELSRTRTITSASPFGRRGCAFAGVSYPKRERFSSAAK